MISFSKLGEYGRLGNQMFQIAATISHSIKMKEDFSIKWEYEQYFETNFNYKNHNITSIYQEPNFHYNEICRKNVDLRGYFQSEKYFIQNEDKIREIFTPKKNIIDKLQYKYSNLLKNSVSLHIRRTDYLEKSHYHPIQSQKYYSDALNYIKSKKNIENVLVFSDDIDWCQSNMSPEYNYIFNSEIDDLFLMSLCENNIIANSSFSWWGSWLNRNNNKIVVAPKKWFGVTYINTSDLYSKEMIIL